MEEQAGYMYHTPLGERIKNHPAVRILGEIWEYFTKWPDTKYHPYNYVTYPGYIDRFKIRAKKTLLDHKFTIATGLTTLDTFLRTYYVADFLELLGAHLDDSYPLFVLAAFLASPMFDKAANFIIDSKYGGVGRKIRDELGSLLK